METLPSDIIRLLTTYLSDSNLIAFSLSCSRFYKVCRDTKLLTQRYQRDKVNGNITYLKYPYITKDGFVKYHSLEICAYCGGPILDDFKGSIRCYRYCHKCKLAHCETIMTKVSHKKYYCPKCTKLK